MFVAAGLQFALPQFSKFISPSRAQTRLFSHPAFGTILSQWQHQRTSPDHLIQYRKVRADRGFYQLILVDGKLRRLIADTNNDGLVDFELWRPDTKEDKIQEVVPQNRLHMTDWKPMEP